MTDVIGEMLAAKLSANVEGRPVLLVDSDTICFRAAAATDGRQYKVRKQVFKYKSDAAKYCKDNDIPIEECELEFFPEPLSHALHIVKVAIEGLKVFGRDKYGKFNMEFFHTGSTNFRNNLVQDYKGNREESRKPTHLNDCKDYVRKGYHEVTKDLHEADDLIGIRAYELKDEGIPYTIVSNDKDMKTIPGNYYNWVEQVEYNSTKIEAMKFFYAQCIAGDTADNIPGVDGLSINNKGTGKAQKIIQESHENWEESLLEGNRQRLEEYLYNRAFDAWLDGGPGKKGSYGCQSLEEVHKAFTKSAQCLFILHRPETLWHPPSKEWSNYD